MALGNIFLLLGGIIIVGFIANIFFKKTKVPEPLFLIAIGLILSPIAHIASQETLLSMAPFVTALVLIIILLDNGLEFNVFTTIRSILPAFLFTKFVVIANIIILGLLASKMLGWGMLHGLLFGTIIAGTTTDIVSTLVKQMSMNNWSKQLLVLESILNDLQLVPFFVLLDLILSKTTGAIATISSIILQLPLSILIGALFAIVWVYFLGKYLGNHPLSYAATVGILFILYGVCQTIGGSGAIAVFTFSLLFGNAQNLMKKFKIQLSKYPKFSKKTIGTIKIVEMDIAFFVKSLFFVFLGLVLDLRGITKELFLVSLAILGAIIVIRYIAISIASRVFPIYKQDIIQIVFLMPRGYIAAVLAFLALKSGAVPETMLSLVLMNILLTTAISIVFSMVHEIYLERKAKSIV